MTRDMLRTVIFKPYRKDMGPTFRLKVWDTNSTGYGDKSILGYRLEMRGHNLPRGGVVLFEGEDFGCSPMHSIDGNETIKGIMCFLTLQPGDTDAEYFESYTQEQLDYCSQHAEALDSEVMHRFGE